MADEEGFLAPVKEEAVGWLEVPKGPKNLPSDPREKVLAVTAWLETIGMSLADVAARHPRWFYSQFLKHIIPKESKIEMKGEILTDVQIDARINHLVTTLGPEVIAKYVGSSSIAGVGGAVRGEKQAAIPQQIADILS